MSHMFFRHKVRLFAAVGCLAVALGPMSSFSGNLEGTLSYTNLEFIGFGTNGNLTQQFIYSDWNYNANDPLIDGKKGKVLNIKSTGYNSGSDVYVILDSWRDGTSGTADPKLYYWYNNTWNYLSDDQGGNAQFKAVIHFQAGCPGIMVPLGFAHWSASDLQSYRTCPEYSKIDPMYTGCNYLEVSANGTIVVTPH